MSYKRHKIPTIKRKMKKHRLDTQSAEFVVPVVLRKYLKGMKTLRKYTGNCTSEGNFGNCVKQLDRNLRIEIK